MSKPLTYDWNGHTDMPVSYPHLTDFQMAGKVRMLMRYDHDHEGVVMGARDRIMGLSKRVEEQCARIETLTAALKPFAALATEFLDDGDMANKADDRTVWGFNDHDVSYGDFRRAHAALAAAKEQSV